MNVARELAEMGLRGRVAIVAGEQKKCRGGLSREWTSPRGGLWLSVLLRPRLRPERAKLLGIGASLAVAKALETLGVPARVLWPNGVVVGDKRVGGILVEAKAVTPSRLEWAIVGIGLYLNFPSRALPEGLRERAATLYEILGAELDLICTLDSILYRFERYCRILESGEEEKLVSEYSESLYGIGKKCRLAIGGETIEGVLAGADESGDLLVETERGLIRVGYERLEELLEF